MRTGRWLRSSRELGKDYAMSDYASICTQCGTPYTAGEEIIKLNKDIANALEQAKEALPDYPWDTQDDNKASQVAWALTSALSGVAAANYDLHKQLERIEAVNHSVSVCEDHTTEIVTFDGCLVCENNKLKAAIWDLIAGAPAYDIPIVAEMIKEYGCESNTCGNPMDGYEFDCGHEYEWECEQCPCFRRDDDPR